MRIIVEVCLRVRVGNQPRAWRRCRWGAYVGRQVSSMGRSDLMARTLLMIQLKNRLTVARGTTSHVLLSLHSECGTTKEISVRERSKEWYSPGQRLSGPLRMDDVTKSLRNIGT